MLTDSCRPPQTVGPSGLHACTCMQNLCDHEELKLTSHFTPFILHSVHAQWAAVRPIAQAFHAVSQPFCCCMQIAMQIGLQPIQAPAAA